MRPWKNKSNNNIPVTTNCKQETSFSCVYSTPIPLSIYDWFKASWGSASTLVELDAAGVEPARASPIEADWACPQ